MNRIAPKIVILLTFYIFITSNTSVISQTDQNVSDRFKETSIHIEKSIDTLLRKTYEELEKEYNTNEKDSILAKLYASAYLEKAKKENNKLQIANGYHFFCWLSANDFEKSLKYADSIIELTKNDKFKKYPTRGYLFRGFNLFELNKYNPALQSYISGLKHAEIMNDTANVIALKHNIALLRNTLGESREALKEYFENLKFIIKQDTLDKFRPHYVTTLYKISSTYNELGVADSGYIYIKKMIRSTLASKKRYYYPEALLISGMNSYLRKDFQAAIDSLHKAEGILNTNGVHSSKVMTNLWIGKSLLQLNKKENAFNYLKKVDSMIDKSNYTYSYRDAFTLLIDHYKDVDNKDKQLELMQKLIQFDSITSAKHQKLNVNLVKNYDTAKLIKEKDLLIQDIQNQSQKTKFQYIIIGILILLITSIIYYSFYKKKKLAYLREFDEKLKHIETKKIKKAKDLEIDPKVTKDIIKKLERFEQNLVFLNTNLTQTKVAKSFKTNSTYLSKIINTHKKKNFANYLNDLRIEYCIKQIETNPKFRLYSVKSIANEVGFNSVQSFSSAFHKKTGKHPSEYIKNRPLQ
ncbi:helix-turn-helix domain-containing protein [Aquimarina sp. D1M17]|uniref:helix-turn-helix domain-containing protein n=1 Tax=Aquimarina acroporae TaxID=2937283 RepID=UPI0020C1756C|nr:helix-turn-helix domain-containing protein [Aquimarina acroporae]MCK8523551.1 helix-turn-helix domain-containing protein [Aquimarina acroporae]